MRSTMRSDYNSSGINFFKKARFGTGINFKNDNIIKKDFSKSAIKFNEKENHYSNDALAEREKLQEAIENQLKSNDFDNQQFRELMGTYAKKQGYFDPKYMEDLLNIRKIEPVHIMKGISEIKNKIDLLDLKEHYMDCFLSIGKYEQGATLNKIK